MAQGSEEWKLQRKKLVVTCSDIAKAIGESIYATAEEYMEEKKGKKEKKFSDVERERMWYGTCTEPYICKWYEKQKGVIVTHYGLAVAKFNKLFGGSPDGLVGKRGCIEIKYRDKEGEEIPHEHMCQMLGIMAIFERNWCDYVVVNKQLMKITIRRILFDAKEWSRIYEKIEKFIADYNC